MIKSEIITINNYQFIRTYSDSNFMIHGGFPETDYTEAIDPIDFGRTYIETDIPIESLESN